MQKKSSEATAAITAYFGAGTSKAFGHGVMLHLAPKLAKLAAAEVAPGLEAGTVYTVDVAADEQNFLDWDKGFKDQSPSVKKLLTASGIMPDYNANLANPADKPLPAWTRDEKKTGRTIYGFVTERISAERWDALMTEKKGLEEKVAAQSVVETVTPAEYDRLKELTAEKARGGRSVSRQARNDGSALLASHGIPGVIYIDHYADKQNDQRMLTVFDLSKLTVTHKNGVEISSVEERQAALRDICAACDMPTPAVTASVEAYLPAAEDVQTEHQGVSASV